MAEKRIKNIAAGLSKEQIGDLVEQITHNQVRLDQIRSKMNKELDTVRDRYREQIEAHDGSIAEKTALVEAWALSNKDEFGKKRSMEFTHGVIGFRLGQFQVKASRGMTLAKVIEHLRNTTWGDRYIREGKPSLDKEAALRDRELLKGQKAEKVGIVFDQAERFYIEPRIDDPVGVGK